MKMVTGHHGTIQMIAHQRISRIVFSFATLCMLRDQYVKMSEIYVCNQLHLLSVNVCMLAGCLLWSSQF